MKLPFLAFFIFFIVACAKAPEQEMAEARRTIYQAMEAGAEEYAPSELKEAQNALIEARSKKDRKDYNGAKELAILAKKRAEEAKYIAEKGAVGNE